MVIVILLVMSLKTNGQNLSNGVTTLLGNDSNEQSMCFRNGQFVNFIDSIRVTNDCPDLTFNPRRDLFSVAFAPVIYSGRIVKMGTVDALREKYKLPAYWSSRETFDSIQYLQPSSITIGIGKSVESRKFGNDRNF